MTNLSRRVRSHVLLRAAGLAAVAGACSLSSAGVARGQAMAQVPADALVVLKINHLAETNTKLAGLLQQLGVTDMAPEAKDPLAAFQDKLGIPATALDAKRDAAVYMANAPVDGDQPPAVVLLPVADYQAFIAAMTGGKTDGGVTTGHFKDAPEESNVAHWGDYAAVTPRKDLLSGPHAGLKATGAAARELDQKDVCLFVNFPALRPLIQPKLAEGKAKLQAQADEKMGDADAGKKELAHAAIDQAINVVDSFLRDAEPTTLGFSIGKTGLSQNLVVAFKNGSYLGNLLGGLRTTDKPLMAGLPDDKYFFFGGSVQDPKRVTQLIDDVAGPVLAKLSGLGDSGAKIKALVDTYKAALAGADGGSVGLVVPTAALGQGSLIRYVSVMHADAEKLKDALEQQAQMQQDLMSGLGVQGANLMKQTITKDAKTVAGVHFDSVKSDVDPAQANNGAAMQAQQVMSYVYGPDGVNMMLGVANPQTLVYTLGADDQLLGTTVEAAKSNKDVLTAQVKAVDAELPKARSAAAYLDLAQVVSTALSYAKGMGMNMPVQLPPNLPPIGFTMGTDPDAAALRLEAFEPTSLLQSLVQAGLQVYLQMPHGGGNGGM